MDYDDKEITMELYYIYGLILLPGIIIAYIAQYKVNSAYKKYSTINCQAPIPAYKCAEFLLKKADVVDVRVTQVDGELTDHYDPKNKIVALSSGVYNSSSIAAIGIASHECGHAIQKDKDYFPLILRTFFVKICNFSSQMLWPLVVIGLMFNLIWINGIVGYIFMLAGIIFFWISLLLNLVTLPVEYNASKRAIKLLQENNLMTPEELAGVKEVLSAAALTYVASTVVAFLQLLRFILIFAGNRRRD